VTYVVPGVLLLF